VLHCDLCGGGAFTVNNNFFDVWMMLGFGVLGYIMKKLNYPIVPWSWPWFSEPAENSIRQALVISGGSFSIFLTRPISPCLWLQDPGYLSPVIRWGLKGLRLESATS